MSKFQQLVTALDKDRAKTADKALWLYMHENDPDGFMACALYWNTPEDIAAWFAAMVNNYDLKRGPVANSARWLWLYEGAEGRHQKWLIDSTANLVCGECQRVVRSYNAARQAIADNAFAHWAKHGKACANWLEKEQPATIRDTPVPQFSFSAGGTCFVGFDKGADKGDRVALLIADLMSGSAREFILPNRGYIGPFPTMPKGERANRVEVNVFFPACTTVLGITMRGGNRLDSECADAAQWLWLSGNATNPNWFRAVDPDFMVDFAHTAMARVDARRMTSADKARTLAIDYGLSVNSIVYASQQGDI